MKNQQLVQQHYDIALKFMQEANYLDAWKNFDKVRSRPSRIFQSTHCLAGDQLWRKEPRVA